MIRLKFKKISVAPIIILLGFFSFFLPFLFIKGTVLIEKKQILWLIWFELVFLFTIFFLWYKIYNEIVITKIENGILYYRKLFFIKHSIKVSDIKGFRVGSEESDFIILYDKNDNKMFVIRMDFYSNYYDFVDTLNVKNLGIYQTVFQRIVAKIFRKKL